VEEALDRAIQAAGVGSDGGDVVLEAVAAEKCFLWKVKLADLSFLKLSCLGLGRERGLAPVAPDHRPGIFERPQSRMISRSEDVEGKTMAATQTRTCFTGSTEVKNVRVPR
jgi:hypothetical protein